MDEHQTVRLPTLPRIFTPAPNTDQRQQVLPTNPVFLQALDEQLNNVNGSREPACLFSLQCKRKSLMTSSNLNQQAPGIVSSDNLKTKLQQQRDEIDQFIRVQGEHLRQSLSEKRQRHMIPTLLVESVSRHLRDKNMEMEKVNLRNRDLEERLNQLKLEAHIWQIKARSNEAMVVTLKNDLKQAVAQSRELSKEGLGDSEADDAESTHLDPNAEVYPVNPLRSLNNPRDKITCKFCQRNAVSILLLPCRHLCICRDCEVILVACPLCFAMKKASVEVYMS